VTIVKGESAVVAWSGTDFIKVSNSSGAGTFANLTVTGNTTLGDASADTVTVNGTTTFNASPVISVTDNTNAALRITQTGTGNALLVEDSTNPDSSPFVIDNGGTVISGYTTSVVTAGSASAPRIQVHGLGGGSATVGATSWSTGTDVGPSFVLSRSEGGVVGTQTIVDSGDVLGNIRFAGSDGTAFIEAAKITAAVDGTPGTNDMPGRLVFSTTRDGASTPTEAMRIDSNQSVQISNSTTSDALRITQTGTGNAFVVEDSTSPDSTPFVIENTGRALVGLTSSLQVPLGNPLQVSQSGTSGISLARFTADVTDADARFAKSRNTTNGTVGAIVSQNDRLGSLRFYGDDGTAFIQSANIIAEVDGTPGTNDMPGRLVFNTTRDGASTPTEAMRITNQQRVGINTAAAAAPLHAAGTTIVSNVDMLNAVYDNVSLLVSGQDLTPSGLFFSPDGRKMFLMGTTNDSLHEYSLSTPWVVSSATVGTSLLLSGQDTSPNGVFFRADGLKMYMVGQTNDAVFQYALTTPWSIATASYESKSFSVATQETAPNGLFFKPDGLSMYVTGSASDAIHQYGLTTAWDVSTASFARSFSVSGQETGPSDLSFTGDGTRMFVLGSTGDDVTVYNLTTPWDISTASSIGQFSVSGQDTNPQGLYVKPDGTKMYMVGTISDTVYQYTVPSVEIQLTGTTSINGSATVEQDLVVEGTLSGWNATLSGSTTLSGGTANGVAYLNGSKVLTTGSALVFNGSNLGLGVTPSAWLSVYRAMQIGGNGCIYSRTDSNEAGLGLNFFRDGGATFRYLTNSTATYYSQSGVGSHEWFTAPPGTAGNAISWTQAMTLDAGGNLGVGTTSPDKLLDVSGSSTSTTTVGIALSVENTSFVDGSRAGVVLRNGDNFGASIWSPRTGSSASVLVFGTNGGAGTAETNITERARIDSSGNLLVGLTSPFSGSTNQFIINSANSILTLVNDTVANSSPAIRIIKAGSTNNTSQIYINFAYNSGNNGNGAIAGNGDSQATFITQSDARLKENIEDLPSQLSSVMALRPVEFDYKATGGHQIGFIAQEVQAVYPDLVAESDDGYLTLAGFDKNTARLIKAIQEQQAIIESLKARLDAANL
jgi:sugar lactone lactonase YvrE